MTAGCSVQSYRRCSGKVGATSLLFFKEDGFKLTKWLSNNRSVLANTPIAQGSATYCPRDASDLLSKINRPAALINCRNCMARLVALYVMNLPSLQLLGKDLIQLLRGIESITFPFLQCPGILALSCFSCRNANYRNIKINATCIIYFL